MAESVEVFQEAMNQGHSAAWDQKWDRAAAYYRQALEEFPENAQALTSLGLALFEMGEYETALKCYLKAARSSPEDPLPLEKAAELFIQLGQPARAIQAAARAAELYLHNRDLTKGLENWSRVAELDPQNLQAFTRMGLINERLNRLQEAVKSYLVVAHLYQKAGEQNKAQLTLRHAFELSPNNPVVLDALSMLRAGRPITKPRLTMATDSQPPAQSEPGLAALPQGSAESPARDPVDEAQYKALSLLAGLLFEGGENGQEAQASRQGFQAIVEGSGGFWGRQVDHTRITLFVNQAVDLHTHGEYAQAAVEMQRALEAGLEHAAAYYELGWLQMKSDQMEKALPNLQKAVQNPDFTLGARLLLAQAYQHLDRWDDASITYLEALRIADVATVSEKHAELLHQLYEPLIEAHRQETNPTVHQQVCENIAGLLMQTNWEDRIAQARKRQPGLESGGTPLPIAELLIQARSSYIVEALSRIHQLEKQGHLRSAMEEAFFALQFAPTYLPLHELMGELLVKMDQPQDAMEKFLMIAQSYITRREPARALAYLRRVIDLAPLETGPRNLLIDQLIALGKYEQALQEYSDFAEVYYNLADLDHTRQTYIEALRLAQRSSVDDDWQVRILHRLADLDMQSLDWRQAMRNFEQIRTLKPDDEDARGRLIDLYFRLGLEAKALAELDETIKHLLSKKRKEQAQVFLEKLVENDPKRPSLRSRLAQFYRQVGRTEDAINQLDVMGDLLLNAGDRLGAARVIEAILSFNPPNADKYRQLLTEVTAKSEKK